MESKKNIVIFLNAFWNNGEGMSGGDQMLIQIFKRIRKSFNEVDCYTNIDGKKVIKDGGVCDIEYHISRRFFDKLFLGLNYILRTIQSLDVLSKKNVAIVYGGSDFFPDVIPAFLYKLFHPKVRWFQCIFHIYPNWRDRPGSKLKNFIAQYLQNFSFLFARKADKIINLNYQVKNELIKKGFNEDKIVVNTPGIDLDYFKNLKVPENTKKYEATFLARLNPSKGIFDLVKIWQKVTDKKPMAKLAIMGGGSNEMRKKLRDKIKNNKLEKNIDILGFVENDEAFSIIKNSKIFLFPSHEEGFGIAIAEAMACGVSVISWDLPVYQEIFESHSIQVKENDIELFSKEILEILNNKIKRANIVKEAGDFIRKYSWELIAQKHLKILNS